MACFTPQHLPCLPAGAGRLSLVTPPHAIACQTPVTSCTVDRGCVAGLGAVSAEGISTSMGASLSPACAPALSATVDARDARALQCRSSAPRDSCSLSSASLRTQEPGCHFQYGSFGRRRPRPLRRSTALRSRLPHPRRHPSRPSGATAGDGGRPSDVVAPPCFSRLTTPPRPPAAPAPAPARAACPPWAAAPPASPRPFEPCLVGDRRKGRRP